ncbi:HD domain-containing protein [bacterium]|nr:HD domain-containing protein [bacterium]
MSFLKRISSVLEKNAVPEKTEYSTNALRRISLSRNAFKLGFIYADDNSNVSLALNNPIQFIYKYLNNDVIDNAIKQNPLIIRILEENKLSLEYNLENVSSIIASHLVPCARTVHKIYFNINKNPLMDDYVNLIQAALLHDIGKVFIPKEILNKTGRLSPRERQIIELHNRLSYEILKTTDLSEQVARLAFEHHDYDNCVERTAQNQALMIADIYCALREVRPYKKALNDIAAKAILYDMGTNGKFDAGYIKYLCV